MAILGVLFTVVALVCGLVILVDAFKSALWKGIVSLLCGLYLLYYGIVEFKHEKKGLILTGLVAGALLGGYLNVMRNFGSLLGR
jgi:threonine/homoserine/homoserine lactone efflux protein